MEPQMTPRTPSDKPSAKPVILPADPMGGGLSVIEVEKTEHDSNDAPLRGPLGETTRKPYENEG